MRYWRKPLDSDQFPAPQGEVVILVDRCKGCGFCVEYCPRDVLVMSKAFNRKGYHPPEVVSSGACVSCNLCEMICPEFAIFAVDSSRPHPASLADERPQAQGGREEVVA